MNLAISCQAAPGLLKIQFRGLIELMESGSKYKTIKETGRTEYLEE